MFRNKWAMLAVILMLVITVSGCSNKKSEDNTKIAQPKQFGVVDMQKAAQAHPKYAQYINLQQQLNALQQQIAGERNASVQAAQQEQSQVSEQEFKGLNAALEQEFNARMQTKQDELQAMLNQALQQAKDEAASHMDAYAKELDQTYQPQIMSLQLKIKTVQLDKDATAAAQQQLDQLQNEKADKLAARQNQEIAHIDEVMAPQKAQAENDLGIFAQQLHAELDQKGLQKQAEISARMQAAQPVQSDVTASLSDKEQRVGMQQQEIASLHDLIEKDIKDKAAKIAVEKDLEAVLVEVTVNVSGVDITNDIIASFNK